MGLFDFFNPSPESEQVSTLSKQQKRLEKPLTDVVLGQLGAPTLTQTLKNQGIESFLAPFNVPLIPELEQLRKQFAGLPLLSENDKKLQQFVGNFFQREAPQISSDVLQKAITQNVYLPGMRAIEQDIIPQINDLLSLSGGLGSSRRGELGQRAFGDLLSQVTGLRAQSEVDVAQTNIGAIMDMLNIQSAFAPAAVDINNLGFLRGAQRLSALAPFQQSKENAFAMALQAFSQPNQGVQSALGVLGTPTTSTQWWQPKSGWDIVREGIDTGITVAAARKKPA